MADLYTTAELITQVKRRGQIPTSQNTWDADAILDVATEELHQNIVPMMMRVREEYFVWSVDTALTSSTTEVPINGRAMGQVVREVQQILADGSIRDLPLLDPDQLETTNRHYDRSLMYYLEWNTIKLVGSNPSGSLRQKFYMRPGSLIETSSAGKITAINTATNTLTLDVSTNPFSASEAVDIVRKDGAHEYRGIDYSISSVSGADVVLDSLPDDLAVGDWVTPAEKSPIPQLPRDLQPLLVQSTVVTILDAMGDPRVEIQRKKLMEMEKVAIGLVTPRNHGESRKIVSGNDTRRWWNGY